MTSARRRLVFLLDTRGGFIISDFLRRCRELVSPHLLLTHVDAPGTAEPSLPTLHAITADGRQQFV